MSIFVLTATSNLSCFANKAVQMRKPLAHAVTTALNEYSPLAPLLLRAVKGRLPRLKEALPAVHALPQVVPAAICDSLTRGHQQPE